ncbi:MAG: phosphoribosylglycinamide formyltransferase [Nitrospinota bacterium]
MRVAILISGRGSNMEALIKGVQSGFIPAEIGLVFSNRAEAEGLAKAKKDGLKTLFLNPKEYKGKEEYDRAIVETLRGEGIDLVCLAGFMRIISPYFVDAYHNRIINIHPSLLPAFPGLDAQEQAIDYGVKYSGVTVHIVDKGVDSGPIIAQRVVEVKEGDTAETLAKRILAEEHKIYPLVLKALAEGRVKVKGRTVMVKE